MAARMATLPDAHAASWREAGVSHSPSSTVAGIAPRWPWRGEHLAERVADVDDLDVGGVDLGRCSVESDDLGGQIGEVMPSRVRLRAKSLW